MRYCALFLLTCFVFIISFNLKAIECPKKFKGEIEQIDESFYEPTNKKSKDVKDVFGEQLFEKSENLELTKEWENLSQEEKDFCTKKIEERLEKTLEEWETKQKYRFLQSKPGIIFLSGIFVIIYIIFRLIRYFLRRSK